MVWWDGSLAIMWSPYHQIVYLWTIVVRTTSIFIYAHFKMRFVGPNYFV